MSFWDHYSSFVQMKTTTVSTYFIYKFMLAQSQPYQIHHLRLDNPITTTTL